LLWQYDYICSEQYCAVLVCALVNTAIDIYYFVLNRWRTFIYELIKIDIVVFVSFNVPLRCSDFRTRKFHLNSSLSLVWMMRLK